MKVTFVPFKYAHGARSMRNKTRKLLFRMYELVFDSQTIYCQLNQIDADLIEVTFRADGFIYMVQFSYISTSLKTGAQIYRIRKNSIRSKKVS